MPNLQISERLVLFLQFIPIFLLSLALHEFAHAYIAYKKGDSTAKALGRMTLNPLKHLDLIGSIVIPFMSFFAGSMFIGWAKPVPVNKSNFANPNRDDIAVSVAGPLSNLLFSLILLVVMIGAVNLFPVSRTIIELLWLAVSFNVFLFLFNLLPIPPLDGSHVITNLFPNSAYARFFASPLIGTLFLFILIFSPLWRYFIALVEFILKIYAGAVV